MKKLIVLSFVFCFILQNIIAQNVGNNNTSTVLSLSFTHTTAPIDSLNISSAKKVIQRPTKKDLAKIKAANIKLAAKTQFQYFIIKVDSSSFGYSIYANGNLYIQQNIIPAVAGAKGFSDTSSAAKTAQLIIKKIKQGEILPTITLKDLKKIGVYLNIRS